LNTQSLVLLVAVLVLVPSAAVLAYYLFIPQKQTGNLRNLMGSSHRMQSRPGSSRQRSTQEGRQALKDDLSGDEYERLKKATKKGVKKKQPLNQQEKFFQAGVFSDQHKAEFNRLRWLLPLFIVPVFAYGSTYTGNPLLVLAMIGIGGWFSSMFLPDWLLARRTRARAEEIMFYLPLVIEQVAIGVSSSLDVGPCLQRIVSMADERDSHNVVTELIRHAHFYVKSGASLEQALLEVGKLAGHTELKHSFMSLSQVAKHGGEITKQLQELAEAVSNQREARVEEKIKKLELEATLPVALVFCGFLITFLVGFFIQIKDSF